MTKLFAALITCLLLSVSGPAWAHSDQDVEKLKGYAAVLGRSGACGDFLESEILKVAAWLEMTFKQETPRYVEIFYSEYQQNVSIQKSGSANEDCAAVKKLIQGIPWPQVYVAPPVQK